MPTFLSHPALPLSLGLGLGRKRIPRVLLVAGVVGSMLPDLDVLAFRIGIPYEHPLGHRGASHSILFALALAGLGAWLLRSRGVPARTSAWFLALSIGSHGLLDTLTTGGKGIAVLWPFTDHRFFAPWQVIRVSPLGVSRFLTGRGMATLASELLWIWLPCLALGAALFLLRRPHPET